MEAMVQPAVRSAGKRQYRRTEEKRRIVEETLRMDASVAVVARRHGVNANQIFHWRKLYQAGLLGSACRDPEADLRLLPVTVSDEVADAAAPLDPYAGAVHIEFPGRALVSFEGRVEPAMVRVVLECLRG